MATTSTSGPSSLHCGPGKTKRETNISNKHKVLENHNWWEANQLAIYTTQPRS